ncbi:hypothetical protein FBU59_005894 [Linderina macrospora]|uniref:Uncharacterized protein n=1 Tax=Linderina macrospora TaxID=4868 RepID=A0ACC1J1N1_9FUNG|nr:hypothetical protein FBU59_005894 [Linderina macrospora]
MCQQRQNHQLQIERHGLYTEYIQWCLLEARSQREFDEAKRAANSDLQRLVEEAEAEKRALAEEQRKCKLMQELTALAKWLKDNRQFMADMKDSIDKVKDPYLQFAARLRETTRAIPLSGVHFESGEALVRDMEHYMETVRKCFSSDEARDAFKVAELLRTYYGEINEEAELLSECKRLKESLAVSANMAVSGNLRLRDSE